MIVIYIRISNNFAEKMWVKFKVQDSTVFIMNHEQCILSHCQVGRWVGGGESGLAGFSLVL